MKRSEFQEKNIKKVRDKVIKFYKQGLTIRQIAPLVERSTGWVGTVVKEVFHSDELDKVGQRV